MRKINIIALAIMVLFAIPNSLAQVMISEVLYDPEISENNGETVVLYNDAAQDIDLSAWILATTSSPNDVTLPEGLIIPSGGSLLIADNDFSLNKPNASWPDADHEEAITLSNTAGGVALMNGSEVIDAVGWGEIEDSALFEGIPHTGVSEGESLLRFQDTNYNIDDFKPSKPFEQFFDPLEVEVEFSLTVESNSPIIKAFEILTDDDEKEGIQIKPLAGDSKAINLLAEVKLPENFDETLTAKASLEDELFEMNIKTINETFLKLEGEVLIDYFKEPGNYEISLILESQNFTTEENVNFEYLELSAFEVEQNLNLNLKAGNEGFATLSVLNTGNLALDINIRGERLKNENDHINVGDIDFSIDNFDTSKTLSGKYQKVINLKPGFDEQIDLKVNALNTLSPGKYDGKIFVKATN
jgi:hypothetical protein